MTETAKMDQEIKKAWIEALRSGEYAQGKEELRYGNAFCCLGVLCDLHAKQTGNEWQTGSHRDGEGAKDAYQYNDEWQLLPESVADWAQLESQNPEVQDANRGKISIAELNDLDYSFGYIANIIEEQL